MATRKAQTTRRTTIARLGCQCPFCNGTTVAADGVYPCRAGLAIEYIAYHQGAPIAFKATELLAYDQLNAYRYDCLTHPIEVAAAEADTDAEIAAFVAEVAQANPEPTGYVTPIAHTAEHEEWRRARIAAIREVMKRRKITGADLARRTGRAPGTVNVALRGNYPYHTGCHLPHYLHDELTSLGILAAADALLADQGIHEPGQANPDRCPCGGTLAGDGCESRACVNFPPTITYAFTREQLAALLSTTINTFTDEAMESPSTAMASKYAIDMVLTDLEFERDRAVRDGDPAATQTIRPALLPLAYKPPIYPTADGYTFEGAGRCYLNNIDADAARREWLAQAD